MKALNLDEILAVNGSAAPYYPDIFMLFGLAGVSAGVAIGASFSFTGTCTFVQTSLVVTAVVLTKISTEDSVYLVPPVLLMSATAMTTAVGMQLIS
jgi:hypothetical protein